MAFLGRVFTYLHTGMWGLQGLPLPWGKEKKRLPELPLPTSPTIDPLLFYLLGVGVVPQKVQFSKNLPISFC